MKGGFLAVISGAASIGVAQTGFNIGGGTVSFADRLTGADAGSNSFFSAAAVSGLSFSLGNTVTFENGTLTQVSAGAWPADASIRLRNSAFPSLSAYVQITTAQAFSSGTFTIPVGSVRPFGNQNANWFNSDNPPSDLIAGSIIPVGSVWNATYYTNYNSSVGVDLTGTGLVFVVSGTPLELYDTGVMPGPFNAFGPPGTPGNTEIQGPPVPVSFRMGSQVRLSGSGQSINSSAPATQRIRLRNTAFPNFFSAEIRPSVVSLGGGLLTLSDVLYNTSESIFMQANRMQNTLRGLEIPAGSRFIISVHDVVDLNPADLNYQWTNLRVRIQEPGTPVAPISPAIEPFSLGTLWNVYGTPETAAVVDIQGLENDQVRWIRFDLERHFNQLQGRFLNIWTEQLGIANASTVLALYNSEGKLLAFDGRSGRGTYSSLTFGAPSATPWTLGIDDYLNTGRDGVGLPKGSYYLGVGTWSPSLVVGDGYLLDTEGPAASTGVRVRFMTNADVTTQTLEAPIDFLGTAESWAMPRTIRYRLRQGGTDVIPWTNFSPTSANWPLVINLPVFLSGPAQLEVDGAQFLREIANITLTGQGQALNVVRMRNGDVDNSGEVDLTDIDVIIGDYLSAGGSEEGSITDLDNNGEVDLTDLDIAIGNYLEADE